jgi:ABC-type Fe3+ transport system permease subunit
VVEIGVLKVSLAAPTALALARALIVAGLAVAVALWLSGWLAAQRGRRQTLAWTLLLAPFFTPPLLISYAFAQFALALIAAPLGHEALYLGVLTLKLAPVAVIIRLLAPPPLSAEGWHAYRLLGVASWRERVLFRLQGEGRSLGLAAGLVFLLAFADFELASLWSVKTWTVSIFDAQIGGLTLTETLRLAATPLLVQIAVLALLARAARGSCGQPGTPFARPFSARRGPWIYLGSAAALLTVLPLALISAQAGAGFRVLAKNFVLGPEIGASVLFALSAAVGASALARWARGRTRPLLLAPPGLLGALVVSLLLLALFQMPLLRAAYDTPLPLALALSVLLLPLALLLGALWTPPTPARHLARQIGSRRLLWELEVRPQAVAFGLLFCTAYFDFTASSILAPTGLTPVFVRLHNLAHYGQTAVLSAMLLAAFAVPVLGVVLAGAAAQWLASRK